ncbi:DUF6223 family protein [Streptomyces sp. NPDC087532]|uniref:DUF6223 family protein n=1 Tax=unclassified Streptomyces TaxID=2593676 RepID=UPI003321BA7E
MLPGQAGARSAAGRIGTVNRRSRAIVALVAGLTGMVIGALNLAVADGGPGTGNGVVGGILALLLGLIAVVLGRPHRRTASPGDQLIGARTSAIGSACQAPATATAGLAPSADTPPVRRPDPVTSVQAGLEMDEPRLRDSSATDRRTWLVIAAHTRLRTACPPTTDLRRPWKEPTPPK